MYIISQAKVYLWQRGKPVMVLLFEERAPNMNEYRSQSRLCERVIRREETETEGLVYSKFELWNLNAVLNSTLAGNFLNIPTISCQLTVTFKYVPSNWYMAGMCRPQWKCRLTTMAPPFSISSINQTLKLLYFWLVCVSSHKHRNIFPPYINCGTDYWFIQIHLVGEDRR